MNEESKKMVKHLIDNAPTVPWYISCRDSNKEKIVELITNGLKDFMLNNFTWPYGEEIDDAEVQMISFKVPFIIVLEKNKDV